MKHAVTTRNVWSCLLVVCALMIWACGSSGKSATAPSEGAGVSALAAPAIAIPVHFVTGSALIRQMPGLEGRNAIEARLLTGGVATGTLTANILDLSAFNRYGKYLVRGSIDCLEFDDATVWFGGKTIESNLPGTSPGDLFIGEITDRPSGGDLAFSGPAQFYAPPGTTCHDRPALPVTPVVQGDFNVR